VNRNKTRNNLKKLGHKLVKAKIKSKNDISFNLVILRHKLTILNELFI